LCSISRNVICKKCRGTGAKDGATKKCPACDGRGFRIVQQQMAPGFNVQMQQTCDKCGGKGVTYKTKCPVCDGNKVVTASRVVCVHVCLLRA
jgi:DnaJ-class molecular chaperone